MGLNVLGTNGGGSFSAEGEPGASCDPFYVTFTVTLAQQVCECPAGTVLNIVATE